MNYDSREDNRRLLAALQRHLNSKQAQRSVVKTWPINRRKASTGKR